MLKRVVAIFAGAGHQPAFTTWLKSNPPTLGPRAPLQALRALHHTRCGETYGSLKQFEHCGATPFAGAAR